MPKVEIQTETVRRIKLIVGCVILGAVIVSLTLAELPRVGSGAP